MYVSHIAFHEFFDSMFSWCQTELFEKGTNALGKEFREELKKYQKPVPPVVTLELLEEEGKGREFFHFYIQI